MSYGKKKRKKRRRRAAWVGRNTKGRPSHHHHQNDTGGKHFFSLQFFFLIFSWSSPSFYLRNWFEKFFEPNRENAVKEFVYAESSCASSSSAKGGGEREREKRIYGPIMRDTCSLLYVISLLVVVYRNHDIISRRASYLSRTPILHKSSSEEVNEWRLKRVAVWMKPDGSPLGVIETVFTNKQQIVQMTISASTECYLTKTVA